MKRAIFYTIILSAAIIVLAQDAAVVYAIDYITDVSGNIPPADLDIDPSAGEDGSVSDNDIDRPADPDIDPSACEDGSVSDNDIDPSAGENGSELYSELLRILGDIELLQNYNSYEGVIPEPYLTYIKDTLLWQGLDDHYVAFVSSYYLNNRYYPYYVLALGDITFSGSSFSGRDVDVYEFYPSVTTYSGTNYRHSIQSSFSYVPSGYFCATDLSSNYPDIRGERFFLICLLILALFAVTFFTITKFGFGNHSFRRHPKNG